MAHPVYQIPGVRAYSPGRSCSCIGGPGSSKCKGGCDSLCVCEGGGSAYMGALAAGSCASHSRTSHSRGAGGAFHRRSRAPEEAMQCAAPSSEGGIAAPRNAMAAPPQAPASCLWFKGVPAWFWPWVANPHSRKSPVTSPSPPQRQPVPPRGLW
jgi:hypothetical protein